MCLTKYYAIKMYPSLTSAPCQKDVLGTGDMELHAFLTLALNGGERLASYPGQYIPRQRAPGTHWMEGWVGPRAGLDIVVKRKIPSLPGIEYYSSRP
jgi:hypothetical protein